MEHFQSATPIWADGPRKLPYDVVGFRSVFQLDESPADVTLKIAASSVYRAWINGQFVSFGPAFTAKGFFRVDEISVSSYLKPGKNLLAIEVVQYGANSFVVPEQPGFLCAELLKGDSVLAATGVESGAFVAVEAPGRLRKVARYSFQRAFSEAYRLSPGFDRWRKTLDFSAESLKQMSVNAGGFLPRSASPPWFGNVRALNLVASGEIFPRIGNFEINKDRSFTEIGPLIKGYPEAELEVAPILDYQRHIRKIAETPDQIQPLVPVSVQKNAIRLVDLGVNRSGFVNFVASCKEKVKLWVAFDEIRDPSGGIDPLRMSCNNVVQIELEPGSYEIEFAEPYTMRYVEFTAVEGNLNISQVSLRECVNPCADIATFACDDPKLNQIFQAAVETFRQNAVDIFMDCPSRERAGWLCDSFFTSRSEHLLTGASKIEHDFLENFVLPDRFDHLPAGMLAMCYPADHLDGVYIPQWSLWFIIQAEEHVRRTGDRDFANKIRVRLDALMAWFHQYENSDGLLERLPSWNFIEWSDANNWTQDVNYPTNMLYSGALSSMARIYGLEELGVKARQIKEEIHKQSYDGEFFVDNAMRSEGKLRVTTNRSEVCQYYAFFFGVATKESMPELWRKLVDDFGPNRKKLGLFPQIAPANAFIGNVLRVDLLSQAGLSTQVRNELIGYFSKMAVLTGTLWEHDSASASCNHGFASYAANWLIRDALGIRSVSHVQKTVEISPTDMAWAYGRIPTPDGFIHVAWEKGFPVRWSAPSGYSVVIK